MPEENQLSASGWLLAQLSKSHTANSLLLRGVVSAQSMNILKQSPVEIKRLCLYKYMAAAIAI